MTGAGSLTGTSDKEGGGMDDDSDDNNDDIDDVDMELDEELNVAIDGLAADEFTDIDNFFDQIEGESCSRDLKSEGGDELGYIDNDSCRRYEEPDEEDYASDDSVATVILPVEKQYKNSNSQSESNLYSTEVRDCPDPLHQEPVTWTNTSSYSSEHLFSRRQPAVTPHVSEQVPPATSPNVNHFDLNPSTFSYPTSVSVEPGQSLDGSVIQASQWKSPLESSVVQSKSVKEIKELVMRLLEEQKCSSDSSNHTSDISPEITTEVSPLPPTIGPLTGICRTEKVNESPADVVPPTGADPSHLLSNKAVLGDSKSDSESNQFLPVDSETVSKSKNDKTKKRSNKASSSLGRVMVPSVEEFSIEEGAALEENVEVEKRPKSSIASKPNAMADEDILLKEKKATELLKLLTQCEKHFSPEEFKVLVENHAVLLDQIMQLHDNKLLKLEGKVLKKFKRYIKLKDKPSKDCKSKKKKKKKKKGKENDKGKEKGKERSHNTCSEGKSLVKSKVAAPCPDPIPSCPKESTVCSDPKKASSSSESPKSHRSRSHQRSRSFSSSRSRSPLSPRKYSPHRKRIRTPSPKQKNKAHLRHRSRSSSFSRSCHSSLSSRSSSRSPLRRPRHHSHSRSYSRSRSRSPGRNYRRDFYSGNAERSKSPPHRNRTSSRDSPPRRSLSPAQRRNKLLNRSRSPPKRSISPTKKSPSTFPLSQLREKLKRDNEVAVKSLREVVEPAPLSSVQELNNIQIPLNTTASYLPPVNNFRRDDTFPETSHQPAQYSYDQHYPETRPYEPPAHPPFSNPLPGMHQDEVQFHSLYDNQNQMHQQTGFMYPIYHNQPQPESLSQIPHITVPMPCVAPEMPSMMMPVYPEIPLPAPPPGQEYHRFTLESSSTPMLHKPSPPPPPPIPPPPIPPPPPVMPSFFPPKQADRQKNPFTAPVAPETVPQLQPLPFCPPAIHPEGLTQPGPSLVLHSNQQPLLPPIQPVAHVPESAVAALMLVPQPLLPSSTPKPVPPPLPPPPIVESSQQGILHSVQQNPNYYDPLAPDETSFENTSTNSSHSSSQDLYSVSDKENIGSLVSICESEDNLPKSFSFVSKNKNLIKINLKSKQSTPPIDNDQDDVEVLEPPPKPQPLVVTLDDVDESQPVKIQVRSVSEINKTLAAKIPLVSNHNPTNSSTALENKTVNQQTQNEGKKRRRKPRSQRRREKLEKLKLAGNFVPSQKNVPLKDAINSMVDKFNEAMGSVVNERKEVSAHSNSRASESITSNFRIPSAAPTVVDLTKNPCRNKTVEPIQTSAQVSQTSTGKTFMAINSGTLSASKEGEVHQEIVTNQTKTTPHVPKEGRFLILYGNKRSVDLKRCKNELQSTSSTNEKDATCKVIEDTASRNKRPSDENICIQDNGHKNGIESLSSTSSDSTIASATIIETTVSPIASRNKKPSDPDSCSFDNRNNNKNESQSPTSAERNTTMVKLTNEPVSPLASRNEKSPDQNTCALGNTKRSKNESPSSNDAVKDIPAVKETVSSAAPRSKKSFNQNSCSHDITKKNKNELQSTTTSDNDIASVKVIEVPVSPTISSNKKSSDENSFPLDNTVRKKSESQLSSPSNEKIAAVKVIEETVSSTAVRNDKPSDQRKCSHDNTKRKKDELQSTTVINDNAAGLKNNEDTGKNSFPQKGNKSFDHSIDVDVPKLTNDKADKILSKRSLSETHNVSGTSTKGQLEPSESHVEKFSASVCSKPIDSGNISIEKSNEKSSTSASKKCNDENTEHTDSDVPKIYHILKKTGEISTVCKGMISSSLNVTKKSINENMSIPIREHKISKEDKSLSLKFKLDQTTSKSTRDPEDPHNSKRENMSIPNREHKISKEDKSLSLKPKVDRTTSKRTRDPEDPQNFKRDKSSVNKGHSSDKSKHRSRSKDSKGGNKPSPQTSSKDSVREKPVSSKIGNSLARDETSSQKSRKSQSGQAPLKAGILDCEKKASISAPKAGFKEPLKAELENEKREPVSAPKSVSSENSNKNKEGFRIETPSSKDAASHLASVMDHKQTSSSESSTKSDKKSPNQSTSKIKIAGIKVNLPPNVHLKELIIPLKRCASTSRRVKVVKSVPSYLKRSQTGIKRRLSEVSRDSDGEGSEASSKFNSGNRSRVLEDSDDGSSKSVSKRSLSSKVRIIEDSDDEISVSSSKRSFIKTARFLEDSDDEVSNSPSQRSFINRSRVLEDSDDEISNSSSKRSLVSKTRISEDSEGGHSNSSSKSSLSKFRYFKGSNHEVSSSKPGPARFKRRHSELSSDSDNSDPSSINILRKDDLSNSKKDSISLSSTYKPGPKCKKEVGKKKPDAIIKEKSKSVTSKAMNSFRIPKISKIESLGKQSSDSYDSRSILADRNEFLASSYAPTKTTAPKSKPDFSCFKTELDSNLSSKTPSTIPSVKGKTIPLTKENLLQLNRSKSDGSVNEDGKTQSSSNDLTLDRNKTNTDGKIVTKENILHPIENLEMTDKLKLSEKDSSSSENSEVSDGLVLGTSDPSKFMDKCADTSAVNKENFSTQKHSSTQSTVEDSVPQFLVGGDQKSEGLEKIISAEQNLKETEPVIAEDQSEVKEASCDPKQRKVLSSSVCVSKDSVKLPLVERIALQIKRKRQKQKHGTLKKEYERKISSLHNKNLLLKAKLVHCKDVIRKQKHLNSQLKNHLSPKKTVQSSIMSKNQSGTSSPTCSTVSSNQSRISSPTCSTVLKNQSSLSTHSPPSGQSSRASKIESAVQAPMTSTGSRSKPSVTTASSTSPKNQSKSGTVLSYRARDGEKIMNFLSHQNTKRTVSLQADGPNLDYNLSSILFSALVRPSELNPEYISKALHDYSVESKPS